MKIIPNHLRVSTRELQGRLIHLDLLGYNLQTLLTRFVDPSFPDKYVARISCDCLTEMMCRLTQIAFSMQRNFRVFVFQSL